MGSILIVTEIQKGAIREASLELAAFAQKLAGESGQEVSCVPELTPRESHAPRARILNQTR